MFSLYADPRQRRADIRDILMTAKTLGLDAKYEIVFRAMQEIAESVGGDALEFETFLRELTNKVVLIMIKLGKPLHRRRKKSQLRPPRH